MKKSLLALAVLSAFAGAASAQTNVTIYGVADAGISYTDKGTPTNSKTWGLGSGLQSGSRLGFKGSEDLGGGLSAIFVLENGFNIDTGTQAQDNRLFGRQAFVGLNGSFGAVKLGRQYNPIRLAVESIDPFGFGLAGNASNILAVYGERADNTINYTSANLNGFTGQLAYSFGEQPGSTSLGRQLGLSGAYANGPVNLVLAYHKQNLLTGSLDNGSAKTTLLGGTYNFGPATLHAAYAWDKGNNAAGVNNVDSRDWLLGASAPVGAAGNVMASYIHKNDRLGANDAKQWALGYTHNLSKRTNLYTSYGSIDNETVNDTKTFNVGVRHKF